MIFLSPLHRETQATWENLFFTMQIIKLRIFGGYISIIGAYTEAKTHVLSICKIQTTQETTYKRNSMYNFLVFISIMATPQI